MASSSFDSRHACYRHGTHRAVSLPFHSSTRDLTCHRIWLALVLALIARLRPYRPSSGLQTVIESWKEPLDSMRLLSPWPQDFSQDIIPKPCHSHNDYSRRVPLFDALAAGCTSIEADIWLPESQSNSTELRVGHIPASLTLTHTLSTLYTEPLAEILRNMVQTGGIFETDPNRAVTILLDFKSDGTDLWPLVNEHLEPLREAGYLRHWNGASQTIIPGPLTIVATGNAPFDQIIANETYRDIFFDAPITELSSDRYNISNSYFASAALGPAVGRPSLLGYLSGQSLKQLSAQIKGAEERGLVSRYWATPAWPISARNRIWETLVGGGVGLLNVDDLVSATGWDWRWCVIAGLSLCG